MRIDQNGNVGIGTTDPQAKLEVQGSAPFIYITDDTETESGIIFRDLQAGMGQAAAIKFSSSDSKLRFYNNDSTAQRMVIDVNGLVGIGTDSPDSLLNLEGAKNTSIITLGSTTNNASWSVGDKYGAIDFYSGDGSGAGAGIKASISYEVESGATGTSNSMVFRSAGTSAGTNNTERMRITAAGNISATGTITGSNLSGTNTGDQDLSGYLTTTGKAADSELLDGIDSSRIIFGNNSSGTNERNVTDWNAPTKTGFYSDDAAANRWASATDWSSILHFKLYDDNNNYASQLGFNTYDDGLYTRTNSGGTWTSWKEIWHAGNDGSGSGLDADLLDGQHASSFANSSHAHTWTDINGETANSVNSWGGLRHQTNDGYIDFGPANTGTAHIYTDRPSFYLNKTLIVNGGSTINSGDIRSDIFYDSDNTGYYLDPASTSYLNTVDARGYISTGNAWNTGNSAWFPNGITTPNVTSWLYGTVYLGNAPGNGSGTEVTANGTITSTGAHHASIFYEYNNTSYYLDPASTSNLNELDVKAVQRWYRSGGAAHQRGDARLDGTDEARMHWYGKSDTNVTRGFKHAWYDGANYIYVTAGSSAVSFVNAGTGYTAISSDGDFRAPIFYDSNNTGYYVDPASTTNLYNLNLIGNKNTYLYINPGTGNEAMVRFNGGSGGTFYAGKRTSTQTIGSTNAYHIYSDSAGATVGGYDSGGNHFAKTSSRAPIFYDLNNTGYYVDPASTSNLWALTVNGGDLNMYENGTYSSELTFQNNTHKLGIDYQNNETLRFITRSGTTTVPITFQMRAGTITASNFILSSDERKKTKIKDLSCDNIDVNWKSFEMKNNEGEYRVGVIAQELEIKHPEFVNTDTEGFKSVKYIDLLIAKIAELEARLEKAGI